MSFPFFACASNQEVKSEQTKMVQAACASLMRDVQKQYGKSFFCKTDNQMTSSMNAAFLVENLNPKTIGLLIRFSNIYYEEPGNTLSKLNYSYNSSDFDQAIAYINAGGGLTEKQQEHLACRNAINSLKEILGKIDVQYRNNEITTSEYETMFNLQNNNISKLEKQCPNGIVLG